MNKGFYLFLAICLFGLHLNAQEVAFEKEPAIDSLIPRSGPNYAHYLHTYLGLGMAIDGGEKGAQVIQPHFFDEWHFGIRYKRKLNNVFALGTAMEYNNTQFTMRQNAQKVLPDTLHYKKQRMVFHKARLELFFRINYDKRRGNSLGNYLDLGAFGDFTFAHVQYNKFKNPDNTLTKAKTSGFTYFNRLGYGLRFRAGFNLWSVYAQYRLSDQFYPSRNLPELPRFTAGLEWTMKK